MTGLETWEVHEAHRRCSEDPELIIWDGYDDDAVCPGSKPRMYRLTGAGRAVCERVVGQVLQAHKRTEKIPAKKLDELERYIEQVERSVESDDEAAEQLERLREIVDEGDMDDGVRKEIEQHVEELEDYIFEWTETAETYLIAMRRVIEDELEVDMSGYFQQAEEEGNLRERRN
jgi:hypothetical protein